MLSMISLQILVRNRPFKYQNQSFETYINKVNVIIDSMPLSINELKDAFSLLKVNKADLLTILVSILLRNALGRFTNPLLISQMHLMQLIIPSY